MRVLLSSIKDWANVGWSFSQALKSVGVDAQAITVHPHAFRYPEQATLIFTQETYIEQVEQADVIIHMHSQYIDVDYGNKRQFVFHGGTIYRERPDEVNAYFRSKVEGVLIQTHDLLGLGAKNEHWLLPCVDTDAIQPSDHTGGPIFAHYPRRPEVKGSELINSLMDGRAYVYSGEAVSWKDNIKRMGECQVYIEELAPPYEWGVTALEAAALGRVVITDFKGLSQYEKTYGPCPLLVANTSDEFRGVLNNLETIDIPALQVTTREWVEKQHSYKAVGGRLVNILQ